MRTKEEVRRTREIIYKSGTPSNEDSEEGTVRGRDVEDCGICIETCSLGGGFDMVLTLFEKRWSVVGHILKLELTF